jgi:hypothetical protein
MRNSKLVAEGISNGQGSNRGAQADRRLITRFDPTPRAAAV